MNWQPFDTWIVIVGVLCACSCALLGNFLVLRKLSLMGDAISHAVLPGLAAAFLLTGSRASLPMFLGAAVVGVLTALLTEWVRGAGKVDEGASMGVVFTTLFALGLLMMHYFSGTGHIDLDPGCVLYGALEYTPLDTLEQNGRTMRMANWVPEIGGTGVPRAFAVLGIILAIDLLVVLLFYKELKISAFDPALATTMGISARLMHYLLMTLVAVTTVAAFESVGSILVVAMLIVPAAAAHLLTDRLGMMIVISLLIAAASAFFGHVGVVTVPRWFGFGATSTAGGMAVVAGLILLLAVLFSPRHGVLSRIYHRLLLTLSITREDALGLLYRAKENHMDVVPRSWLLRALEVSRPHGALAIQGLLWRNRIVKQDDGYKLTESGRLLAEQLLRSHRLWESYLFEQANVDPAHVHRSAEKLEHVTSRPMREALDAATSDRPTDPQGKTIPPERI